MKTRNHDLKELTDECEGYYDGDQMMIVNCSCKPNKKKERDAIG